MHFSYTKHRYDTTNITFLDIAIDYVTSTRLLGIPISADIYNETYLALLKFFIIKQIVYFTILNMCHVMLIQFIVNILSGRIRFKSLEFQKTRSE